MNIRPVVDGAASAHVLTELAMASSTQPSLELQLHAIVWPRQRMSRRWKALTANQNGSHPYCCMAGPCESKIVGRRIWVLSS